MSRISNKLPGNADLFAAATQQGAQAEEEKQAAQSAEVSFFADTLSEAQSEPTATKKLQRKARISHVAVQRPLAANGREDVANPGLRQILLARANKVVTPPQAQRDPNLAPLLAPLQQALPPLLTVDDAELLRRGFDPLLLKSVPLRLLRRTLMQLRGQYPDAALSRDVFCAWVASIEDKLYDAQAKLAELRRVVTELNRGLETAPQQLFRLWDGYSAELYEALAQQLLDDDAGLPMGLGEAIFYRQCGVMLDAFALPMARAKRRGAELPSVQLLSDLAAALGAVSKLAETESRAQRAGATSAGGSPAHEG